MSAVGDEWEFVGTHNSDEIRAAPTQWKNSITFWVNGEEVTVYHPKPSVTLLDWLREERGVLGTHVGCGEGGCGICTVALVLPSGETVPINSCLRRLCAVDGCHVVNTEGLGNVQQSLHPLQKQIANKNGSQCGFCTPGWVMNMYALLQKNPSPTAEEIEQNFDGNLCRCTGYRPILNAFGEFAKDSSCCHGREVPQPVRMTSYRAQPLHFVDSATAQEWYRPLTPDDLKEAQTAAVQGKKRIRYTCANTAEGVVKYLAPPTRDEFGVVFIDISHLLELNQIQQDDSTLQIGAAISISTLIDVLEARSTSQPTFKAYAQHLKRVASVQIRAVGSWAGNVMLCRESNLEKSFSYFPSDIVLVLATAGATLAVTSNGQNSSIDILQLMQMKGDVFVRSMSIPLCPDGTMVQTYKAMQRHVFSHAIVNMGVFVSLSPDQTIQQARVLVGGATAQIQVAGSASRTLVGSKMTQKTLLIAINALLADIRENPSMSPLNSSAYRESLATSFLYKFFMECQSSLPPPFQSATVPFTPADARPVSCGTVSYGTDPSVPPLGEFIPKLDSNIQASGEARYSSDHGLGALFGQLVFSTRCNGTLTKLCPSHALTMPGVRGFVGARDIPVTGTNNAALQQDEQARKVDGAGPWKIFFEENDVIPAIGMPLGMILADTWAQARVAAKKVIQHYDNCSAPVTDKKEALQSGYVLEEPSADRQMLPLRRSRCQSTQDQLHAEPRAEANLTVKGNFKTRGQSHFFMETNAAVVVPVDGNRFEIYNGQQSPDLCQQAVSMALGIPCHQIVVKNARVGGAFGGKIFYQLPFVTATAVAAYKTRRTVRLQNERSDDMQMMGNRHPIEFDYQATFDSKGMLDSLAVTASAEQGWVDAPCALMGINAAKTMDNNYNWPIYKAHSADYLTNSPSNTAMRAPPTMQSALAGEVVLEHVAKQVGIPLEDVMCSNFYKDGDFVGFGKGGPGGGNQIGNELFNWTVPVLWKQIQQDSNYEQRKQAVEDFNRNNQWKKKGIAISTCRWDANPANVPKDPKDPKELYGPAYTVGAHVAVYSDGSVMVASGGVEMGQGLNTKVAQAAAYQLGCPLEKIVVGEGNSHILPNSGVTGGSNTSENCVYAMIDACKIISKTLHPYTAEGRTWDDVIKKATADSVINKTGLLATAWNTGDWDNRKASERLRAPSPYNVYGACVSEVLVDMLTGEVRVERVDILMDFGDQLNAAIDVGQVEGGFIMALGYLLTEEQKLNKSDAKQLNLGSWDYKVPTAYDIPIEMNVSLLKNTKNPNGVRSSKAVAEPVMHLISSPYLAVKNAIYAGRKQLGLPDKWTQLDLPLSPENIQQTIWHEIDVPASKMILP